MEQTEVVSNNCFLVQRSGGYFRAGASVGGEGSGKIKSSVAASDERAAKADAARAVKAERARLTALQTRIMVRTGMMPLDFLTAVYRDQLYADYEQQLASDGVTIYWSPAPDAQKLAVDLQQRIHCATAAAPYVHKKMPVGIEVSGKNNMALSAEKLRALPTEKLELILALLDDLGIASPAVEPRLIGEGAL